MPNTSYYNVESRISTADQCLIQSWHTLTRRRTNNDLEVLRPLRALQMLFCRYFCWNGRLILISQIFIISNLSCSQVMLPCSLVSGLFLFLLYELSFPLGYLWSATSSFTLKLQWERRTKIWFGENFWLGEKRLK